ncbi:hypothetical protein Tco_1039710 [Tanacetum coccineum]
MKKAVDVAIQLQSNKLREEAQAENQEFLNQVDSTMKAIIKEQVQAEVSKIMPRIEKHVTKSLEIEVLDEDPSAGSNRGSKRRRSGKEAESSKEPTHKESRLTSSSKGASRSQPRSSCRHAYWGTYHWGLKRQIFYGYASNLESSYDVHSRHMIITVTSLKIMKWYGYSHLEEIIIRRQDDKLYKFREGDFKRLRRQDIEDMLHLLVQDKLTNLNLEERYALNVALRMFTRRIIIQERVEDLQLGVESYQKKINLQRPDSYRSDLRRMTSYTAYPDIQGIIYEDELNRKRLMCTDELHKFSDGTLNYVRTALSDIDRGIEMDYLPKRKWSKHDK